MRRNFLLLIAFLSSSILAAQLPKTYTSSEIYTQIEKLNVAGSVLYIAAHPDDENTGLIAYLSNVRNLRTGYLSLTRGDGGQNLIGKEQSEPLGLIRTQELLNARRDDGGEQFFTRAIDFGFSKSPKEALSKWNEDTLLHDVVKVIRTFQPDLIITRFPEDGRAGHGHHSASGILARLGFENAGNDKAFADQLSKGLKVWQPKRVLWNVFVRGGEVDKSLLNIQTNTYSNLLGKSIGELSGEARSEHKSQGFGVRRQREQINEYFEHVSGEKAKKDILDGINISWARYKDGNEISKTVTQVLTDYDFRNPARSIPALQALKRKLVALNEKEQSALIAYKIKAIDDIIYKCAALFIEFTTAVPYSLSTDTLNVQSVYVNRSSLPVTVKNIRFNNKVYNQNLVINGGGYQAPVLNIPNSITWQQTQPYWLNEPARNDIYTVTNWQQISRPQDNRMSVEVTVAIAGEDYTYSIPIHYKRTDPVKSEIYNPLYVLPEFTLSMEPELLVFRKDNNDSITVKLNITSQKNVQLNNPVLKLVNDAKKSLVIDLPKLSFTKGEPQTVTVYAKSAWHELGENLVVQFIPEKARMDSFFGKHLVEVVYDHIPTQIYLKDLKVKVLNIDLKITGKNIGYIDGSGDLIPEALTNMGYQVTVLKQADLVAANLKKYDAIVTGIRAYNVHTWLDNSYQALMDYVKAGGNLIVQYNTNSRVGPLKTRIAPYNMTIDAERVTDENAKPNFLLPNHPALNYPNKITAADFNGWVQERSIYHAKGLDSKFQTPLGFSDFDEKETNGSLAIAPYGKGNFVYTGLVFFRQLPAGNAGAYRLLANLLSLPKN
ncbi:PIG-L family deacetylase [Polluticaenibacter yanchengensis]|uniref:PIG-L family deacetylase n=1 Tax=Polluticaenibacter yanchengensis TaxID=3014562 RepID=A0ABT4UKJ4_9BACT|nr:PIG-L family deacetylase [Chitinophagaceae bacterium LY-5]